MIKTKMTEMFGLKYPIANAPMGPFYTTQLAIAVSEKGGLGVISHTNLVDVNSIEAMEKSIYDLIEHTDKPFGINIRTARLQTDNKSLIRKVAKLINSDSRIREQLVYGLTSAGTPRDASKIWKKKAPSLKHFHVAPALRFCDKIMEAGCDGLVVTGYEGGGHQSYEGVNTMILLAQACGKYPEVPIIACGGFADGNGLAAALACGADGIAMGTRFIASNECEFHENYKKLVVGREAHDTIMTTGSFGPVRLLENKYSLEHGKIMRKTEKMTQEAELSVDELREDLKKYELVYNGSVESGPVLVGQTVGLIDSVLSVEEILDMCERQAEKLLKNVAGHV